MSKQRIQKEREERGKRAGLRTWALYLLALAAWVTAVIALALLGFLVCSRFTWYENNPLYQFLDWVRDYIVFVCIVVVLAGWVVISYYFIARSARDLEWLLSGAEELAHPTDAPIRLPQGLKMPRTS